MPDHVQSSSKPRPKLGPIEQAIVRHLLPMCDRKAFGFKYADGRVWQQSRERLERDKAELALHRFHSNPAPISKDNLAQKLGGLQVAMQQRGEGNLLTRSDWASGYLRCRWDIDCHHGQTDGMDLLEWGRRNYFPRGVHHKSSGGESLYFWIKVPTWVDERTGEEKPAKKIWGMNAFREQLHGCLGALAKQAGFKSTSEIHGSFVKWHHHLDEYGQPESPSRLADDALGPRTTVKEPVLESVEQVLAHLPEGQAYSLNEFAGLIEAGARALATQKKITLTQEQRARLDMKAEMVENFGDEKIEAVIGNDPVRWDDEAQLDLIVAACTPKRKRGGAVSRIIEVSPAKHVNAYRCAARATQLLGIRTRAEAAARRHELYDLGLALYAENRCSENAPDEKTFARMRSAVNEMIENFNDAKASAGTSEHWFELHHCDEVAHRILSMSQPAAMFRDLQQAFPKVLESVLRTMLGMAANTMAKNVVVDKHGKRKDSGEAGVKAVQNMLAYHGLPKGRTLVSGLIDIVIASHAITQTHEQIKPHWDWSSGIPIWVRGIARRWRVNKAAWFGDWLNVHDAALSDDAKLKRSDDGHAGSGKECAGGPLSLSQQYKPSGSLRSADYEAAFGWKPEMETTETTFRHEISPKLAA